MSASGSALVTDVPRCHGASVFADLRPIGMHSEEADKLPLDRIFD